MLGATYDGEALSASQSPTGKVARIGKRSTEETNDDDRRRRKGTHCEVQQSNCSVTALLL